MSADLIIDLPTGVLDHIHVQICVFTFVFFCYTKSHMISTKNPLLWGENLLFRFMQLKRP